jgi:hypothetical protein
MGNTQVNRIEEQVRSAFPEGAVERVQVLAYGDDPAVEPGETAVRVFISRAGRPEGMEADKEIIKAFEETSHAALRRLDEVLPSIGWIDFRPATQDEPARTGPFGTADRRGHREQPRRSPALGRGPHPRASRVRPDPGPGSRDQRPQGPVLTDSG